MLKLLQTLYQELTSPPTPTPGVTNPEHQPAEKQELILIISSLNFGLPIRIDPGFPQLKPNIQLSVDPHRNST